MKPTLSLLTALLLVPLSVSAAEAPLPITFQINRILKDTAEHPLGIQDPTFLADVAGSGAAIRRLGVRFLRVGDPRDAFWSEPPWERANPVAVLSGPSAWPANDRNYMAADGRHFRADRTTDFEESLALAQAAGAEPIVILTYNSLYKPPADGLVIPPRERFFAAAEAQVRYALHRKVRIRYWELGNELWNRGSNGHGAVALTDIRRDLAELVPRLRAIDPGIRILVSGDSGTWYRQLLASAPLLDAVNFSWYLWEMSDGYESFRASPDLLGGAAAFTGALAAIDALPAPDRDRIGVVITEFNALDWAATTVAAPGGRPGWENRNDLGHALCVFQMAGEALAHPRVRLASYWCSQWMWPPWQPKIEPDSVYNALRQDGSPTATGLAVAAWGNHLLDAFVQVSAPAPLLRTWASRSADGKRLHVFLLNKDRNSHRVTLHGGGAPWKATGAWRLAGEGPRDLHPRWEQVAADVSLLLPADSATVVHLVIR